MIKVRPPTPTQPHRLTTSSSHWLLQLLLLLASAAGSSWDGDTTDPARRRRTSSVILRAPSLSLSGAVESRQGLHLGAAMSAAFRVSAWRHGAWSHVTRQTMARYEHYAELPRRQQQLLQQWTSRSRSDNFLASMIQRCYGFCLVTARVICNNVTGY